MLSRKMVSELLMYCESLCKKMSVICQCACDAVGLHHGEGGGIHQAGTVIPSRKYGCDTSIMDGFINPPHIDYGDNIAREGFNRSNTETIMQ